MSSRHGFAATKSTQVSRLTVACVAGALVALLLASPALADRYIYWGNSSGLSGYIGRSNINGTGANATFLAAGSSGLPSGVALNSSKIFWRDGVLGSSLFTTNLDGTATTSLPVTVSAPNSVGSPVAADESYLYFTIYVSAAGGSSQIVRIGLDGSNQTTLASGIAGTNGLSGLAVDGNYVYYASPAGTVGRVPIGGGSATSLLTGLNPAPSGLAVNSTHIFWGAGTVSSPITRANLDGTNPIALVSGLSRPAGVAVDSTSIFWTDATSGTIGRANLDGSSPNSSFIAGAFPVGFQVRALAVSATGSTPTPSPTPDPTPTPTPTPDPGPAPAPSPSNEFKLSSGSTVGGGRYIRTRITITDPGRVSQRGTRSSRSSSARSAAAGVCSTSRTLAKAGTYALTCKVNSATRKAQKKGKVRVLLRTTFVPTGGTARTVSRIATLASLKPRYTG